jgi:hypothetical protein
MLGRGFVRIELTSTLTQEDESRLAPAILKALSGLLDMLPIAYIVRVETTDEHVLQHVSPKLVEWDQILVTESESTRPAIES